MKKNDKKSQRQPIVYAMANDQCVWGRAGVIKPTKCLNAFDCLGCSLDKQVLANFEKKQQSAGIAHKRSPRMMLLVNQGKCRHMLSGRISYGMCSYGYDCVKCPFDQMMEDATYLPNLNPPVLDKTSGFSVARDHYYHYGHSWARVEYGGRVRIGIDDFTLRLLGPQDEIEFPRLGTAIGQNRPHSVLRRSGKEAAVLSPVDGKVVAINHKLLEKAATANKDPYGQGWLMIIQPTGLRKNLKNLFFGEETLAWIDDEASRLRSMLGELNGEHAEHRLAATGGDAIDDIYGAVPEIGWDRLVNEFLHSL